MKKLFLPLALFLLLCSGNGVGSGSYPGGVTVDIAGANGFGGVDFTISGSCGDSHTSVGTPVYGTLKLWETDTFEICGSSYRVKNGNLQKQGKNGKWVNLHPNSPGSTIGGGDDVGTVPG